MNETRAKSPKVCFLVDSYLVYEIQRDSEQHQPALAEVYPGVYLLLVRSSPKLRWLRADYTTIAVNGDDLRLG